MRTHPFANCLQTIRKAATRREAAEILHRQNMMYSKDLLAVEAVIGEPVSTSVFPVSRENTGNFCRLRPGAGDAALPFPN